MAVLGSHREQRNLGFQGAFGVLELGWHLHGVQGKYLWDH